MSTSPDAVAAAVAAVPGVARLSRGSTIEIATYLPERRVHGVRMRDDGIDVHVVAHAGTVLPDLADDIRRAVAIVAADVTVGVFFDDLEEPAEATAAPTGA